VVPGAIAVALLAAVVFGIRLAEEPRFVDESALTAQSYFADLLLRGDRDNPAWLEYPGYDSSPLPKYLIGLALRCGNYARPGPAAARDWFRDTSRRFVPDRAQVLVRWPFVLGGVLGCVAIYALGVLARDRRTGAIAALLLTFNPLYRLHARRAMADVLVEAFLLACLAFLLWVWRRSLLGQHGVATWVATVLGGVAAALSALAKLNGMLCLVIVAAWAVLGLALPGVPMRRRLTFVPAAVVATAVAAATFVALNPFLTAHPRGPLPPPVASVARLDFAARVRMLFVHRVEAARDQVRIFPHNALHTPAEKLAVAAVQGFGRFGPFGPPHSDSTRRFDRRQDGGALLWLPWVAAGLVAAIAHGRRQRAAGAPPTDWAIAVQAVVAALVVTAYLPLAWDRYLLPLQPGSALLAAGLVVAAADRLGKRWPESLVVVLLLGSYSYFWHARDWNSASRLMLTYALVDRGTVRLDGLDRQTGDKALDRGHYYCDKLPGYSLLATGPYAVARLVRGLPDHPLDREGFPYWEADYWVTLGTSGLATALSGLLLFGLARDLGCGPRRAALVALAYGLATPAYAYATLAYGHQLSALALLASFALLWRTDRPRDRLRVFAAGFLAAAAAVIELSLGPVSAILGTYLVAQVLGRTRRPAALWAFAAGAAPPTLVLLGYNQLCFGSPWDMGYFHHATGIFAQVHSRANPLGLRAPDWHKALPLLWGGYRGLAFYAPVTLAALPGWIVLARRRQWGMAAVSALVVAAVFLVNLSYPEWTGGWSTGPRLLVPLLPFALLPVAGLLATGSRVATLGVVLLALAGAVVNLLFQGVGARLPQYVADPLLQAVWPAWCGAPMPGWWIGGRFTRNLVAGALPGFVASLPDRWQWLQFLPLVAFQGSMIAALWRRTRADAAEGPAGETPP
jgi:hypothetical protein